MSSIQFRLPIVLVALVAASATWPAVAEAQRHRPRGPVVRAPVVRSVVYVSAYRQYGWWGAGYWGGYAYPPYSYYRYPPRLPYASVRIDVDQRQAEVFVDGYAAGLVDDFDGIFQRLTLEPGGHEITIHLPGFRTITESLYLRPGADHRIRLTMTPLAPGETSEPPPAPSTPAGRGGDPEPRHVPRTAAAEPEQAPRAPIVRYGTLALRVQPGDAEILVDGEPWSATASEPRLSIRLAEGRHKIEVRKAGFTTFTEDVLIQPNRVLALNVSLIRGGW